MSENDLKNPQKKYAIEEWRQLQSIIEHLENQEYAIRRWLITIIAALTAVSFSKDSVLKITEQEYGITAAVIVILFLVAELSQRVPKRKAIWRNNAIEACLRGEQRYSGPKISISLSEDSRFFSIVKDEVTNPHVTWFYFPVFVVIAVIGYVAYT